MKRLLLSLSILLACTLIWAQQVVHNPIQNLQRPVTKEMRSFTGLEKGNIQGVPGNQNVIFRGSGNIGDSTYDLQTNATAQNRIVNLGDETLVASWTRGDSPLQTGWPNRGSGFNISVNSNWAPSPSSRIEADARTGWPGLTVTGGLEAVIVCHQANPSGGYYLHINKRGIQDTEWTEKNIPHTSPFGALWPRIASGGLDGNTVHVIGVATPTAFDGVEIDGVDSQLLYYRSQDGGNTWDITDAVIPGLDSSNYVSFSNDAYAVDAFGNTVAVAIFSDWNDLEVAISQDNGETWTVRKVIDFPLDKYVVNSGIDTTLIPDYEDAPTSTALFTSDGTGDVKVDANGNVHVVFGRMYLEDQDLTDAGWTFYPGTNGVNYWNSSYADNEYVTIAGAPDLNGNDTLDMANAGGDYFSSMSSQPSLGFDADGNMFMVYSAVHELLVAPNSKHYRHVYMVTSQDGGETWDEVPLDLTEQDEDLLEFIEGGAEFVYPQIAKSVDHKMHILLHADAEPGLYLNSVTGNSADDTNGNAPTLVWYLGLDNLFSSVNEENIADFEYQVYPNPANEQFLVKANVPQAENVRFTMFNLLGEQVLTEIQRNVQGQIYFDISSEGLAKGTYFGVLQIGKERATQTIMIQ